MAKKVTFDVGLFFAALDSARQARKSTWKDIAKESGVSASTLTRMAQGKRPDVDGLAALSRWSGLDIGDYVRDEDDNVVAEPLAMISTYLKGDRNLSPEAATAINEMIKAAYAHLRKDVS